MYKLLAALVVAFLFAVLPIATVSAIPSYHSVQRVPAWNIEGSYTIGFDCPTCVPHYIEITSHNVFTGVISGSGYYVANPGFTWTVGGSVSGVQVSLRILYTGQGAGYYVDLSGVIAQDGTMSGTATDSSGGQFAWATTSGHASNCHNHGQFVKSQADKRQAAISDFGMPVRHD